MIQFRKYSLTSNGFLKKLAWKRGASFLTGFLLVPLKKLPWKRSGSFLLPCKSLEIKRWFTKKMKLAQKIVMGTKMNNIVCNANDVDQPIWKKLSLRNWWFVDLGTIPSLYYDSKETGWVRSEKWQFLLTFSTVYADEGWVSFLSMKP